MEVDLGREKLELTFYEAPMTKKQKAKNEHLKYWSDRLIRAEVSLVKYSSNNDIVLNFEEFDDNDIALH